MIKDIIYKFTSTHEKRRLLENFFSLSVLQAANYILPLITLPYLVRVLGVEKFGLIAFAQAFIQYFVILTGYGFNFSATREVSIHRDNKEKLSVIVSSVFVIKILFLIISMIILSVVLLTVPKFRTDWLIYVFSFGMVFDNILFPVWFYQGVENMKYITIRNVAAKLVFTILIFVFVRNQSDYMNVPLINSLGMIVAGVFGLIPVFKKYGVALRFPKYTEIVHQLNEGWHVFTSQIFISIYTTTNTFALGLFTNNEIVGYYSAAEKIFKAVQSMGIPVANSMFPLLSKKVSDDRARAIVIFGKLVFYTLICTSGISLLICCLSPIIVRVLLGTAYDKSTIILSILAGVIFASWANYTLGIQGLINFGYKEVFSRYVMIGAIVHVCLLFVLIKLFGYISVPIVWLFTESLIGMLEYRFLVRKGILNLFRR